MKIRTLLSPAQATWLADTIERNRDRYAGHTMMADGDGDGAGDADGGSGGDGDGAGDGTSASDKGFPEGTKPDDMAPAEQAAYYRHQARKHEDRNKDLLRITGGRYGEDLKKLLDERETMLDERRTDGEKAVEDAKRTTRTELLAEFGTKLVAAEFRAALAHVDGERRDQIIEGLSLEKYLTSDGEVDTAKVTDYAATIAPAGKETGSGNGHDYGGGKRQQSGTSGVKSGRDLFEARRKKTTSTTGS